MVKKYCLITVLVLIVSLLAIPDTVHADLTDGLIGYWPMDEGEGAITEDLSIGGNDGVINGDPQWVTGVVGKALDFDGDGDYVACGKSELLRPETEITVQAWVNVGAYSYYAGIVANHYDSGDVESGYCLVLEEGGWIGWGLTTSAITYNWPASGDYLTGTWYHLVATYEDFEKRLWINGELAIDTSDLGPIDYDPLPLYGFLIGRYWDNDETNELNGIVDEVAVWNRVLTQQEVLEIYNGGAGKTLVLLDTVPSNGATFVPRDQVLSWSLREPMDVVAYDVYFGTDPNVADNPKVVDYELVNSHDPYGEGEEGLLEYGTTYYWRVDIHEPNDVGTKIRPGIPLQLTTVPSSPIFNPDYPEDAMVEEGGDAVFVVDATNPVTMDKTEMTYAWYKLGEPEMLSDTDTLTVSDATLDDEGYYYCTVTVNQTGDSDDSRQAVLVIKKVLGHWPFDGTLEDIEGGNDGTYLGGGSESYDTGVPGLGVEGSALSFDGNEGKAVTVPSTAVVSGFWSVAFWDFSPDDIPNAGYMVASGNPEGWESMYMRRWEDSWIGGLERYVGSVGEGDGYGYLGPYARGQWHHHVMTYDPVTGTATWYIDGAEAGRDSTGDFTSFDPAIYIGNRKSGERAFEGLIDDLWLYSYPLTPLEVAQAYTFVTGGEVCMGNPDYDFNEDCRVDILDLSEFLLQWLECNRFPSDRCF